MKAAIVVLYVLQAIGYVGIVVGLAMLVKLGGETRDLRQRANRAERGL